VTLGAEAPLVLALVLLLVLGPTNSVERHARSHLTK
jgi:hypothetical protein